MPSRDANPVRDVIGEYFGKQGLKRRIEQAGVVNDWPGLVGERLARITTPVSVDPRGILWVRVSSPSWLQELHLMSRDIERELAAQGQPVKAIRWVAGSPDARASHSLSSPARPPGPRTGPPEEA